MKTAPMMVCFLPRFRWFAWGFGLCATMLDVIGGTFSPVILIFFTLGLFTYPVERVNRRIIEANEKLKLLAAALREAEGENRHGHLQ